MAQPITLRSVQPAVIRHPQERKPDATPYAEAVHSAYELLQLMHDRRILDLLRGMVGAGDKVIEVAAQAIDTPETIRGIRNFLLLTNFFASIPPEVLNSLVQAAVDGARKEK